MPAAAQTRGATGASPAEALTDGFAVAFEVGTLLCLAGAAVAALLLRPAAPAPVESVPATEEPEPVAA